MSKFPANPCILRDTTLGSSGSKVDPCATSIRLNNTPPSPDVEGTVLAGSLSVIVLAVTSWRRLSIAPGSVTLESGTSIVMVPFAPRVDKQLAAGSVVAPGYVIRTPPPLGSAAASPE